MTLAIPYLFEIQLLIKINRADYAIIPLSGNNIGAEREPVNNNENN